MQKLTTIPGLKLYGPTELRAGVFSFTIAGVHPHDMATILDKYGVAVRAGHHCAMPLMQKMHVPALTRASLACYNNEEDIDTLCLAITEAQKLFGVQNGA